LGNLFSFQADSGVIVAAIALQLRGVGHKPEPVSLVRRSNIGSSHNSPPRVIPERGKVSKDSGKSSMNEHWAVLHEDVAGSYFANHPRHVLPHSAAFSINSGPFSCD
jgi:hypothetical protein